MDELEEAVELLGQVQRWQTHYRLDHYTPYPYQIEYHHAIGEDTNALARQRALMSANQIGKTTASAMEMAMHLTGRYPSWWGGHRFNRGVIALCGAYTNEQTRDVVQAALLGDPVEDASLGSGAIPIANIGQRTRKPGVPNAYDSVMVPHACGENSKVSFRAYEQGAKKHMGSRIDVGWCDEEPPADVWSQYLRATFSTDGILMLSFTPEAGVTDVVYQFVSDLKKGQALITATWDDAPHMTLERRERFLAQIPAQEREMRTRGVPLMGSGLVFPIPDEQIMCEPIEIPSHWPKVCAIDFGWDHPFAAVWLAHDRETDTAYIYREFRESKCLLPVAADAVKKGGEWIPVVWPHDVGQTDPRSGRPLADIFRDDYGLNMLPWAFSNPPGPGQREGQGGHGIEAGIMNMLTSMEEGRFKVFSSCQRWFEEKGFYHRKEGRIVAKKDDLMAASRYAFQSMRHAQVFYRKVHQQIRRGARLW